MHPFIFKGLISPEREEGLFARRDIARAQIAAFYAGLIAPCDIGLEAFSLRPSSEARAFNRTSYILSLAKTKVRRER